MQGAAERGGAERILLALARGLRDHGIDTTFAFLADGPFVAEASAAGFDVDHAGDGPRFRDLARAGETVAAVAAAADRAGAEVLLANGEKMAPYTGWAARRLGVPAVTWLHDAPLRDGPSAVLQLALKASPHGEVVAGSQWMADRFERWLRMPVHVIRHGIPDPPPLEPIRAAAGWPESGSVLAAPGRLQRWKGADVAVRALARLVRAGHDARLAVIGGALYGWEEAYARSLPRLAVRLGVADRVWFAGHRDDAWSLVGSADCVLHCSRRPEPLGLVVPEAMAQARPVVATRTLGPEEVIDHGRTGLLYAAGDDRALATAVSGVLADPARAAAMGEAARDEVRSHWSVERMAGDFARLLLGMRP